MVDTYKRKSSDSAWLADAAKFHGHLGPWLTVGTMIGRDALHRLKTPGYWHIEVICWMPPEKQRLPFTCIMDGLQVASGATLGKMNIRMDWNPQVVHQALPVVYVIRRATDGRSRCGLAYGINKQLAGIIADVSSDRLEEVSRQISKQKAGELFTVRPISEDEFAVMERQAIGG